MAPSFGPGVSRTLEAAARQFTAVVWQLNKPPMDAEFNLVSQNDLDKLATLVRSETHSGFFLDPTQAGDDILTSPLFANQFVISPPAVVDGVMEASPSLYANVNGWIIPVAGSFMPEIGGGDNAGNRVKLNPPPTTGNRVDLVFLEVWQALISPNPSTTNKPAAGYIWKYGNTEYGGVNIVDDLQDPALRRETAKRVQLQYAIRVVGSGDSGSVSIDLVNYPDGLTDPQVLGQGASPTPVGGFTFSNMRSVLGDPSLWRAGDGNSNNALGTIDGYVYAIPICAVFRRNTASYVSITGSGTPNQNGAAERTPSSHSLPNPQTGARTLAQAVLDAALEPSTTGWVTLDNLSGSALNDPGLFPIGTTRRYLVIDSGINTEIIAINQNTDPVGHPNSITIDPSGRGRAGTMAKYHAAGTSVSLYNSRPDGLYADQISPTDLLDMRRSVSIGGWDYNRLLQHALSSLATNDLRTTFKRAGTGGPTVGPVTVEVSYLQAPAALPFPSPSAVDIVDGPDGIRNVWSDSAAIQRDVTVVLDPAVPLSNNFTVTTFNSTIAPNWGVGADFQPHGFLNIAGGSVGWTNGTVIFLDIGGATGTGGARAGIVGGQQAVRFLAPSEMFSLDLSLGSNWVDYSLGDQQPWKLRFTGGASGNGPGVSPTAVPAQCGYRAGAITSTAGYDDTYTTASYQGPMYPSVLEDFTKPFIVLGGVLNSALYIPGLTANSTNLINVSPPFLPKIKVPGISATYGLPLGRDGRSWKDYLTHNGQDRSGLSSEMYLILYGDQGSRDNNGVFKVVGAGNTLWTDFVDGDINTLIVIPMSADWSAFDNTGNTVTVEIRSMDTNAEDDNGRSSPPSGLAVVFTDLRASSLPPWSNIDSALALQTTGSPARLVPVASKAVLTMSLLWNPGHGSSTRVPDLINRFAAIGASNTFVRNNISSIDPLFVSDTGYPSDTIFEPTDVHLWNRLPSLGEFAPYAPNYGGGVVGLTEQDRECELFVDSGSKTVMFRPLITKFMIMKGLNTTSVPSLVGPLDYPASANPKDAAAIFTTGKTLGYVLPPEYVPRFGRQDIPYHTMVSTADVVLSGINHLFCDSTDDTQPVFYVVGGLNNSGPPGTNTVLSILFTSNNVVIPYGLSGSIGAPIHAGIGARKKHLLNVVSSDLGPGMWGIELPPYHGIARLYGVYEYNNFVAHLNPSYVGAFQSDRITPITNPPTNLLRVGADKQTLFINKGGANDVTGLSDSHTYIVPDSAIDITLIPGYDGSQTFDNYNYVIECVVFGFAEGFINKNQYVLGRKSTGTAVSISDSSTPELVGINMVLPSAAPLGEALYQVYDRTVYQGDPYMTSGISSAQPSDYQSRYGQIPQSDAYDLATPIQQFNPTTGAMTVTRPNPRALEVLASADFYTTLGTGKVGGTITPGTVLDCGYTDTSAGVTGRIPSSPAALPWRIVPKAFTASTTPNATYASAAIQIIDHTAANTNGLVVTFVAGGTTYTTGVGPAASNAAMAAAIVAVLSTQVGLLSFKAVNDVVYAYCSVPGPVGNQATASISAVSLGAGATIYDFASFFGPNIVSSLFVYNYSTINFSGGSDFPANGGDGSSSNILAGMTGRLPLGILASDSDFIGENILDDSATAYRSYVGSSRYIFTPTPLTSTGVGYTPSIGDPGSLLAMSDGSILDYIPYTVSTPSGTTSYRIYRGGGSVFVLSGIEPGGPVPWVAESFQAAARPVLKGAVLACRAFLVRNYHEDAFGISSVRTEGDEIQMLILTQAIYGTPTTTNSGVVLGGTISPTGYGEGYAAADRFLIPGRPMDSGHSRTTPNPGLQPAPYIP